MANDAHPTPPPVTPNCPRGPLVIPVGETQQSFTLRAFDSSDGRQLPPGDYEVRFLFDAVGSHASRRSRSACSLRTSAGQGCAA